MEFLALGVKISVILLKNVNELLESCLIFGIVALGLQKVGMILE